MGQIRSKFTKFQISPNVDQFQPVTFKFNFYIFGTSKQFAIRKSTILIYRATSIFDLHMRNFNLQGLGAPDKPKKKIKYAEIDFTSYHSFLRLRKVKKIN
jgi:hypothetical protein